MGVICYLVVDSVKNQPIDWIRVFIASFYWELRLHFLEDTSSFVGPLIPMF